MKMGRLGNTDLIISQFGLGTMMMGWRMNADASLEVLAAGIDHRINFIDCSVSYGRGAAHQILGNAISALGVRQKIILATKVGGMSKDGDSYPFRGAHPKNIIRQCELSLKQLNTSWIDLLQLHMPSEENLDDQLDALDRLRSRGLIRYYGVCNHSANEILAFHAAAKVTGRSQGFISHQFCYNLLEQVGRRELLAQCESLNLGSIVWGPLSSGLLTDKYFANREIQKTSRIGSGKEKAGKELLLNMPSTQATLKGLEKMANISGKSIQRLAIEWLANNNEVKCILLGPSNLIQLLDLLDY